jgi:hypothetical protein
VQLLVVWGLLKQPDLLRSLGTVTIATMLVVHTVEEGGPRSRGWVAIRGGYFLLVLVLLAFSAVVYAATAREVNEHEYGWDLAALTLELILARAAVTYARRTP